MKYPQCEVCVRNIASVNLWGNALLALVKAVAGFFGNSHALIADSIHSISDVAISMILVISLKISGRPANKTYPYGYGHIDFVTACFIGIVLICVGTGICYTSVSSIFSGDIAEPELIAVLALLLSIAGNELLYHYTICAGKQAESEAITATAWENHADALTSLAALAGVIVARLGYPVFDLIGAITVGLVIIYLASRTIQEALHLMMDISAKPEKLKKIHSAAAKVTEIKKVNSLVTRKSGRKVLVDMEVAVDSGLNLKKANIIINKLKKIITESIENAGNINVYIKPHRVESN